MNSTTIITPGNAKFAVNANTLLYESSHELLNFMFADRAIAEETLRKLYEYQHGHFSYRFSTLAIQGDQVVGLQLGYDSKQLAQQEFIGSLLLFFNSPIKRWWPLVKKISPILDEYIPKPTPSAYYINNIAVSSSCRGSGVGKLLLANTLKHAELSGYQCVELDVTSVNEGAIRFYERNGFATVSTSGSEMLHNNYGLPPLIRMQHRFQNEMISDIKQEETNPLIINDVTALNPTKVSSIFTPGSIEQLQILLCRFQSVVVDLVWVDKLQRKTVCILTCEVLTIYYNSVHKRK